MGERKSERRRRKLSERKKRLCRIEPNRIAKDVRGSKGTSYFVKQTGKRERAKLQK